MLSPQHFSFLSSAACGKVGDPKPPIKRSPQAANGLAAGQSGYVVTLSWTNPARYIDNNGVTDLAAVLILRNGVQISRETATAAGTPQSFTVDVTNSLGTDISFAVQVETQRGRVSTLSSSVPIRPVEVPGPPVGRGPLPIRSGSSWTGTPPSATPASPRSTFRSARSLFHSYSPSNNNSL